MILKEKQTAVLKKGPLFDGISVLELQALLSCIGAGTRDYQKDEIIICAGDDVKGLGIVLEGEAQILREDAAARQSVMDRIGPSDTFQEVLACAGIKKSPVTVRAVTGCTVMFLNYQRIVYSCSNSCSFHSRLIQNLLQLIAQKNLNLNKKINYLILKSLREKLSAYLLDQSRLNGSLIFTVPFDRNGLAGYLNVERSALSRELGRMRDEGLIEYWKNSFKLLNLDRIKDYLH